VANPHVIRDRRHDGDITASLVDFVEKGRMVALGLVTKGIEAVGVSYQVEMHTNAGPDSRCELGCEWGHIENKYGTKPTGGYCSGHRRRSDHKSNMVGCTAKLRSLCSHTLEKYTDCKRNHIVFSNRCAQKTEALKVVRQSWGIWRAGWASMNAATGVESGINRVTLGYQP
jgi:hypothetical protein